MIGEEGRAPEPPDPAYQQILKGVPAADFSTEELLYLPRNLRAHRLYGFSPVEQIALTINIALRRDAATLDYYRAGSTPDAFATLTREWTADQIRSFQDYFDALMSGNLARRRQTKFMPADFKLIEARQPPLKDQYDEWLARRSLCGGCRRRNVSCCRRTQQFRALEQKENIFLTAYAGRGIVSYSGRMAPTATSPRPPHPLQTTLSSPAPPAGRRSLASPGACMSSLELFLPLAKVDLDRRLVTGVATAETPDRSGEIFDYTSSKPYFEKWSAEAAAASGGKSLGAVRVMHTPIAAGKLTDIAFDDDAKRITVCAKIVDDDEWRKVQEGVYTGFSQGGRYVKRWADPDTGLTRYTAEPHEISLVDLPCVPDATFDVVKDGLVERRGFASRSDAIDTAFDGDLDAGDEAPDADKRELSAAQREKDAEEGGAMPDGAYPIRSAKDVENAVRDYYRSGKKADVKAHIIARAKAIGAESALPDGWTEPADRAAAFSARSGAAPAPDALAKAAAALTHAALKLDRATAENARLRKALDEFAPALADMKKRIAALEAQPLPAKAALRSVTKTADGASDALVSADDAVRRLASLPADERALALTKLSLANPAPPPF